MSNNFDSIADVVVMSPGMRDSFAAFSRNGRWGTCSACPRDVDGNPFPEFCQFTERYDHLLTLSALVFAYEHALKVKP